MDSPSISSANTLVRPVYDSEYRVQHDSFMWMLYAGIDENNQKFNIKDIILSWWKTVMPSEFPTEGGNANELSIAIQYQALMNGFNKTSMKPSEKFLKNYKGAISFNYKDTSPNLKSILKCQQYSKLAQIYITQNLTSEVEMAVKKKAVKKSVKKAPTKKVVEKKAVKKKAVKEKVVKEKPVKEKKSKEPKVTITSMTCELVTAQKLSDEKIFEKLQAKFPDHEFNIRRIDRIRKRINVGHVSNYPAPKVPYQAIGGSKKSVTKKVVEKKAVKKKVVKQGTEKKAVKKRRR